jgi:hypothetical protein
MLIRIMEWLEARIEAWGRKTPSSEREAWEQAADDAEHRC